MEAAATASGSRSPWDGFFWPPWGWCFLVCPSRPWVGEKGISQKVPDRQPSPAVSAGGKRLLEGIFRRPGNRLRAYSRSPGAPNWRGFFQRPKSRLRRLAVWTHLRVQYVLQGKKPRSPSGTSASQNTCCIARFFPGAKSRLRRLRLDAPAGAVTPQGVKRPAKAACWEILNRL